VKHHNVIVETLKNHVATSQNRLKIPNHGCNTAESWLQHVKIMFSTPQLFFLKKSKA
jgi:hypothetical protein